VELCEAVADVIIVELRHMTAEERAALHDVENKVYQLQAQGKLSAARKVCRFSSKHTALHWTPPSNVEVISKVWREVSYPPPPPPPYPLSLPAQLIRKSVRAWAKLLPHLKEYRFARHQRRELARKEENDAVSVFAAHLLKVSSLSTALGEGGLLAVEQSSSEMPSIGARMHSDKLPANHKATQVARCYGVVYLLDSW
jgi:hypothetical protein